MLLFCAILINYALVSLSTTPFLKITLLLPLVVDIPDKSCLEMFPNNNVYIISEITKKY